MKVSDLFYLCPTVKIASKSSLRLYSFARKSHFNKIRMTRESLDTFLERGILALVLAILVFAPLAMGAVDAWSFLIVQGLTIGVMLLWMLRLWLSRKPQLLWPPLAWVVFAFTAYAIGRYLKADIEYIARLEMIQVLMYAFLFLAIVNNLYRHENLQIIIFTMIFVAMGISGYAIFQFLAHSNWVWIYPSIYPGRASGTYISPNDLAGFLEMLLPLATAYILVGRMKPILRVLLGYAALVMAAGLVVTFSRGGWAAAAIALLSLLGILIAHRAHRLPALLLLIALIGGGMIFGKYYLSKTTTYIQRVEKAQTGGGLDLEVRYDMWWAAFHMWQDHFWWGVGPGLYDYRFREYRPETIQSRPEHAHNDYLNLLADWGATGGMIVLAGMIIFGAGLTKTWRYVRRSENDFSTGRSNRYAFFVGATTGLLALTVHSIVDFNLHIPANAILGVTLLALLSSNLRFATNDYWATARLPDRILLTMILVCGVAYLGSQAWRRTKECTLLEAAENPKILVLDRATILKKAFAVDPNNFETAYKIGEAYRIQSFVGNQDYQTLAQTAMRWYSRCWKLDPYYGYAYLRYGMCLDWLNHSDESGHYFSKADALDPNGYYTAAEIGWHYAQIGDYAAARTWLTRSYSLCSTENETAQIYLKLVDDKLLEEASSRAAN